LCGYVTVVVGCFGYVLPTWLVRFTVYTVWLVCSCVWLWLLRLFTVSPLRVGSTFTVTGYVYVLRCTVRCLRLVCYPRFGCLPLVGYVGLRFYCGRLVAFIRLFLPVYFRYVVSVYSLGCLIRYLVGYRTIQRFGCRCVLFTVPFGLLVVLGLRLRPPSFTVPVVPTLLVPLRCCYVVCVDLTVLLLPLHVVTLPLIRLLLIVG